MPVLHIGDIEIVAHTQQLTSPALHIKNADGEIYHVAVMPVGGGVFDASETLVYEENTINTCQSFELPAGIYRVEMRGGTGGKPYRCSSGTGTKNALGDITSNIFKLNTATTLYALRGGDGNNSATVNIHQIPGGGASGVDSILVIGNRTIRANGGTGTRCLGFNLYGINALGQIAGASSLSKACYGGAGSASGLFMKYGPKVTGMFFKCADGGNGASADSIAQNGADITNTKENSMNKNTGYGGSGGTNTTFNCNGQTAISYGGGGGGGICMYPWSEFCKDGYSDPYCGTDCFDGGDGGSGSTGTSNDSFIKIFKIG